MFKGKSHARARWGSIALGALTIVSSAVSVLVSTAPTVSAAAHSGACTSADTKGNSTSYQLTNATGQILATHSGFYTQAATGRGSTSSCVAYGSGDSQTFKQVSSGSLTYTGGDTCGPGLGGSSSDTIILASKPPDAGGSVKATLKTVTGSSGKSDPCGLSAGAAITVAVTASSGSCTSGDTFKLVPKGPSITEYLCASGSTTITTYINSGDDKTYVDGTQQGNVKSCQLTAQITLDHVPSNGETSISASFQKLHTVGISCGNDGAARSITVTLLIVDVSGVDSDFQQVALDWAGEKCDAQNAQSQGSDAEVKCLTKQVAVFQQLIDQCKTTGKTTTPDIAQCLIDGGKVPEVATELQALVKAADSSSCNIDGIGWMLCPILTAGAGLADSAYGFLADSFLSTDPSLVNTDPNAVTAGGQKIGTGTYTAWKIMQAIANVAFVIVFLIIIFSQLTNAGVSNFGVKKMLPRLIIGAVLVNVSFYVCQLAIDLSNIVGYSLKDLLTTVAQQVTSSGGGAAVSTTDESGNLAGIAVTVLAVGAAAWINVGALAVAIVGAIITLLTIFVLLIARKALIVLLVVVAPLAFVAYLLPNTEQYFKKWRQLLTSLLLLFPIIGVLYGACLLASAILKQVAGSDTVMQIAAYIVLVVPLIAAIPLLKGSLDGVGKIGGAIQGLGGRVGKSAGGASQKGLNNSRLGQFKAYRSGRWAQRRAAIQGGTYQGAGGKANPLNWLSGANRGANRIGGRFGAKLTNQGAELASKEDAELLGNAGSRLDGVKFEGRPLSQSQLLQIAKGQEVTHDGTATGRVVASAKSFDEYSRRAAIERAGKNATVSQAHDLVDSSGGMSVAERKALASSLAGSSAVGKASYLGGRTLEEIAQGSANSDAAALGAIQGGKITAEALASGDKDSVAELVDVAMATPAGSPERAALKAAHAELMKPDSRLRERIVAGGDHDAALGRIAGL